MCAATISIHQPSADWLVIDTDMTEANRLPFTKMQGVGNDFILIDARRIVVSDWPQFAIKECARRTGIGADGLLLISNSDRADLRMEMFNPDGTPDVCGNGLRCVTRYAADRILPGADAMTIETSAGIRRTSIRRGEKGAGVAITVSMGAPLFEPESIPADLPAAEIVDFPLPLPGLPDLPITALSTGSTHAVTFRGELPADEEFFAVSPLVENAPIFPERTSLMWTQVAERTHLSLRIWERGAGETLGCGTGACAAAVAAIIAGLSDEGSDIAVESKGGTLMIRWRRGREILMTGPAEYVFTGDMRYPVIS